MVRRLETIVLKLLFPWPSCARVLMTSRGYLGDNSVRGVMDKINIHILRTNLTKQMKGNHERQVCVYMQQSSAMPANAPAMMFCPIDRG
jgi:hypothetical protein